MILTLTSHPQDSIVTMPVMKEYPDDPETAAVQAPATSSVPVPHPTFETCTAPAPRTALAELQQHSTDGHHSDPHQVRDHHVCRSPLHLPIPSSGLLVSQMFSS